MHFKICETCFKLKLKKTNTEECFWKENLFGALNYFKKNKSSSAIYK